MHCTEVMYFKFCLKSVVAWCQANLLRECGKEIGASMSKGVAAIPFGPNFWDYQKILLRGAWRSDQLVTVDGIGSMIQDEII